MIFGAVLAGGIGSRMKQDMPKQFLPLGDKPIILKSLDQFLKNDRFDVIYAAVNGDWVAYFKDLLGTYGVQDARLRVVPGGSDRNETIMKVIADINRTFGDNREDVIITHDAVRPFVTQRIINENIDGALTYGVCDTVIPAIDTIVRSPDGEYISSIPLRSELYQSQTPQSFNLRQLRDLYQCLTDEQKALLTDACKIFTLAGKKVRLIRGESYNIKITTAEDYRIAQAILKENFAG